MQCFLPRSSLLTIYISFVRPHLDYGDVIYDQPSNATFSSKVESMQFNAALAITGVNRDSAPEKLYQGLEPDYPHGRRWMRRLWLFYKVLLNKVPKYIYRFILLFRHAFRNPNLFTSFTCRTEYFKNSFFPSVINHWNPKFAIVLPILVSKNALINFIRPSEKKNLQYLWQSRN